MTDRIDWLVFSWAEGAGLGLRRSSLADRAERVRWEGRLVTLAELQRGAGAEAAASVCRLVLDDRVIALHRSPTTDPDPRARIMTYAYLGDGPAFEPRTVLATVEAWHRWIPAPGEGDAPIDAARIGGLTTELREERTEAARQGPHDALRRLVAEVLRDPDRGFSCRLPPGTAPAPLLWGLIDLLDEVIGDGSGRYWTFSTEESDDTRSRLPRFVFLDEWRPSGLQPSHFRLDLAAPPPPGRDLHLDAADALLDAYRSGGADGVRRLLGRVGARRGRLGEAKRIARLLAFAEGMGVPVAGSVPKIGEDGEPTVERRRPDSRLREPYPLAPVPEPAEPARRRPAEPVSPSSAEPGPKSRRTRDAEPALPGIREAGPASPGTRDAGPTSPGTREAEPASPGTREAEPAASGTGEAEPAATPAPAAAATPETASEAAAEIAAAERTTRPVAPPPPPPPPPRPAAPVPEPIFRRSPKRQRSEQLPPSEVPGVVAHTPAPAPLPSSAGPEEGAVRVGDDGSESVPVTRPLPSVPLRREVEPVPRLVERLRTARDATEIRLVLDDLAVAAAQDVTARAQLRDILLGNNFFRDRLADVLPGETFDQALRELVNCAFAAKDPVGLGKAVELAGRPDIPQVMRVALLEVVAAHGGAKLWLEHHGPSGVPQVAPRTRPRRETPGYIGPPRPRRASDTPVRQSRLREFMLPIVFVLAVLILGTAVIFLAGVL